MTRTRSISALILSLVAAATMSMAAPTRQDSVTISSARKVGAAVKHKANITMSLGGLDATIGMTIATKVTKADESKSELTTEYSDVTAEVGGTDPGIVAAEMVRTYDATKRLIDAKGGIQGGDTYRLAVVMEFFEYGAAHEKGKEVSFEIKENKEADAKKLTVKQTYLGVEKVGDVEGHKFMQKVAEEGETGLTSEVTFILQADGTILSIDGKFTNMPVPAAGTSATGTFKAKIVA